MLMLMLLLLLLLLMMLFFVVVILLNVDVVVWATSKVDLMLHLMEVEFLGVVGWWWCEQQ